MKTPEELAEEFAKRNKYSIFTKEEDTIDIFLAGYEAAEVKYEAKVKELEVDWKFCCEDKARALKELAVAEKAAPQWISVKDRLPDPKQVVVVFGSKVLWVVSHIVQDQDGWLWVGPYMSVHPDEVTHWVPLPEPPEGE